MIPPKPMHFPRRLSVCSQLMCCLIALYSSLACSENTPYLKDSRIDYIANSLLAMQATKPHILENTRQYISVVDTNNCQSDLLRLRLNCLMSFAEKNCKSLKEKQTRTACKYYSDIIVSNRLGEKLFLSKGEEYRLAKTHSSAELKAARSQKLRQKYASIATQFILSESSNCKIKDHTCMATGLDEFCASYTNKHNLSWNYCVSATLWLMSSRSKSLHRNAQ